MKILHIVHCIDTEGPLNETLKSTFDRIYNTYKVKLKPTSSNLEKLQKQKIKLGGIEKNISNFVSKSNLNYINNLSMLKKMLNHILSKKFRYTIPDDFGKGWVYSWHCVDHIGYKKNPRKKIYGYGKIFHFYKKILKKKNCKVDEINWHFHPKSLKSHPTSNATSYNNSINELTYIISRRIIEDDWFPVVNRPGFHSIRPDSHLFLEQWMPYDYSNQFYEEKNDQKDLDYGRFGDWSRSPKTWAGYNPSIHDYQLKGNCRRKIFRCLNVGTRHKLLKKIHIDQAFKDANKFNKAILCIVNHDYREMSNDVLNTMKSIQEVKKKYKNIKVKYSGAEEAAFDLENKKKKNFKFRLTIKNNRIIIKKEGDGKLYGSQPFFAIKTKKNEYFHDNLDVIKKDKIWSYIFDFQTIELKEIKIIGVGSAGRYGGYTVAKKKLP
jgi:hypothetical protein